MGDIAAQCGLPAYALSRVFRKQLGLTPAAYVNQRKLERFKAAVKQGQETTAAVYSAGYGAPSRLYEDAPVRLGMTPASYAKGGKGASIAYALFDSPPHSFMGRLIIAATFSGLCFLAFGDDDASPIRELHRNSHRQTHKGHRFGLGQFDRPHLSGFRGSMD